MSGAIAALGGDAPGLAPGAAARHVFADLVVDAHAAVVAAAIDPVFLAEAGWDAGHLALLPPNSHPLLGRPVCRAPGCATTAKRAIGICFACQRRLAEHGLSLQQIDLLAPAPPPRRMIGGCTVAGCAREWVSARRGLCRDHADLQVRSGLGLAQFLTDAVGLPALADCAVTACRRQRRGRDTLWCEAHQQRFRAAAAQAAQDHAQASDLDQRQWARTEPPISCGGEVVFRGLPPLVIAQVLAGLAQRCRLDAVKTDEADLRGFVNRLRRSQATSLHAFAVPAVGTIDGCLHSLMVSIIGHAGRVLARPDTEVAKDVWDLMVFGHAGRLDFTKLSQDWLRQAAKRWAAEDLPRRRVAAEAIGRGGGPVGHHLGCLARLSQSLRMRDDRGEHPAALGRADMEAFLHRLAYLQSVGQISLDARIRACREVRSVLAAIRAMGLTRPGAIAAGLGDDFAIHLADIPAKPEAGEAGRALPPQIMRQICAHLDLLTTPEMRTAVQLAIDTGRRPEEIAALPLDCLHRDADGAPVLVYDNRKAGRNQRRLPISQTTAAVITAQQQHVRSRYPNTPIQALKLLPSDRRNPDGAKALTAFTLGFHHRTWVERMPALTTSDGVEFDKSAIVLYAYRHTYAQRHADAGVPIDVLRELMDHRKLDTTKGYYHKARELHQTGESLQVTRSERLPSGLLEPVALAA